MPISTSIENGRTDTIDGQACRQNANLFFFGKEVLKLKRKVLEIHEMSVGVTEPLPSQSPLQWINQLYSRNFSAVGCHLDLSPVKANYSKEVPNDWRLGD